MLPEIGVFRHDRSSLATMVAHPAIYRIKQGTDLFALGGNRLIPTLFFNKKEHTGSCMEHAGFTRILQACSWLGMARAATHRYSSGSCWYAVGMRRHIQAPSGTIVQRQLKLGADDN